MDESRFDSKVCSVAKNNYLTFIVNVMNTQSINMDQSWFNNASFELIIPNNFFI